MAGASIVRDELICPLHGWRYDAHGLNVFRPDMQSLSTARLSCFEVEERDGQIVVSVDSSTSVEALSTGSQSTEISYGSHDDQVADLIVPAGARGRLPVVALLHGGFWKAEYRRDLMAPLVRDITDRGWAAFNMEYRRVGAGDGGWPNTFADVASALDRLERLSGVDPARVVLVGHSAGGHLALWAAARRRLSLGVTGAAPRVLPRAVVALAPVADLEEANRLELGGGAVGRLMSSAGAVADWLGVASPAHLLPLGVPQVIVHGISDDSVPVAMSRNYAERARAAGDSVSLFALPGTDHMDLIVPTSRAWTIVSKIIAEIFS